MNAEESRAVGVSGLQPRIPPLYGSSHLILSSWSVAVWRSRERSSRAAHQKSSISEDGAKPPLLLSSAPVTSICCFCQQGVVAASIDSEVSVGLLRPTGTRRTLRGFAFTISAFRILSHWLADRPWFENRRFSSSRESKALSNDLRRSFGIRSVPTRPCYSVGELST